MAAFGYWSDTTTWTGNVRYPSFGISNAVHLPTFRLSVVAEPVLSMRAWARVRLAALRALPTPKVWTPLEFPWSSPAAAPRRTVVPRGRVSWIRAGTRRPL